MTKRTSFALVSIISLAQPQLATAEHSEHAAELDKMMISAPSPTPMVHSHEHLNLEQIADKASQTSDTASLLKGLPGVSIYGGGGVSGLPAIRGLADDRLRIKVDGMDLISACANHMNPPMSYIAPSNVESITLYPGISPVSSGGDSIGGSIIVNSKAPSFATGDELLTKGEFGTYYRSNGNAWGSNLSATLASDRFSINYEGSYAQSHNYDAAKDFKVAGAAATDRGPIGADEVGSTAYQSRNDAIAFAYKIDPSQTLQLKLGLQSIPDQGWPNQRMDMVDNRSRQINLMFDGSYAWGDLHTTVYNEKTNHKMQFGDDKQFLYPNGAEGMPMETEGHNTGLALNAAINLSERDLLRVGTDIQRYRLDDYWEASGTGMMSPDTFWNINGGQRDRYAVYGEWQATWNQQWMTLAGLRQEIVKMDAGDAQGYDDSSMAFMSDVNTFNAAERRKTDHNTDWTLLTKFTPTKNATYQLGLAQKTRSPNLYERYSWSTNGMVMRMVNLAGDGNGYVGNLELEPEIAHTISFSADWHDQTQSHWGVNVAPYLSYVDDYIDAERCSSTAMMTGCTAANLTTTDDFVYLRYNNVSAKLYGIDVTAHTMLYQDAELGHIHGKATISYVKGENRDTGDNLYNIMPLNATFILEHAQGRWHSQAEWELVSAKDDVNAERNEVETGGYGLLNLRSSYDWGQTRVDFGVSNVFDKFYSQPLAGAYLGEGQTMSAAGVAWGDTVPAMGRSFFTGLTVKF